MNGRKNKAPTRICHHNNWYDKIPNNFYGIVNILHKYVSAL